MINLITSFYISRLQAARNNQRNNEIRECLDKNLKNSLIEKIHLYVDDNEALEYINSLNNDKIHVISIGAKPLYSDFFSYALTNLKDKICMISNSDIYLADCVVSLFKKLDNNTIFALTRYESDMTSPMIEKYCGSHDCFIFNSKLNFINNLNNIKHIQNVWGSENVVLYELKKANIKVYNPCYQIITVHLHESNLRNSDRKRINQKRSYIVHPDIVKL